MSRFVTSDHHFAHDNIRRYCARPFASVQEMDEAMAALWNETVAPGDEVYHLGDFYWINGRNWFEAEKLLKRLHGRIHLIKGDHDPGLPQFERQGFGRLFASMKYWDIVDRVLLIHDYENRVPATGTPEVELRPLYDIACCGHVHRHWLHSNVSGAGGVALNVGCDLWHFRPVEWTAAVECQKKWLEYCGLGKGT